MPPPWPSVLMRWPRRRDACRPDVTPMAEHPRWCPQDKQRVEFGRGPGAWPRHGRMLRRGASERVGQSDRGSSACPTAKPRSDGLTRAGQGSVAVRAGVVDPDGGRRLSIVTGARHTSPTAWQVGCAAPRHPPLTLLESAVPGPDRRLHAVAPAPGRRHVEVIQRVHGHRSQARAVGCWPANTTVLSVQVEERMPGVT
jgi:hypothetical protein